ncbi:DUF2752 domain-containing protein [Mucilaginibacter sp. AW1-3]
MIKILSRNLELIFWVTALLCLSLASPVSTSHFTLCPFRLMGFSWCPGCGLGHSIIYLFHGRFSASWHAHWLGVPAVAIIFYRITQLFSKVFVTFS